MLTRSAATRCDGDRQASGKDNCREPVSGRLKMLQFTGQFLDVGNVAGVKDLTNIMPVGFQISEILSLRACF